MMKNIARFIYHFGKNAILRNYRYFRLSPNERGKILFYDRDRKSFFSIQSRGFIDSVTANQIYSNNEYNFAFVGRDDQVFAMYEAILQAGKTPLIIDCGANIGLSAQYFARRFPRAKIIGVEPDASNFSAAERHSAEFPQITIHNAAIGSQPGFVQIANEGVDANAFQVVRTDADGGVPVKTIPEIFSEIDDAELFIVKIDIEGFERDLFAENTDWIAYCDILIVELHDWMLPGQASSLPFIKAIAAHQRDFLFKGESVFSFRNDHLPQG